MRLFSGAYPEKLSFWLKRSAQSVCFAPSPRFLSIEITERCNLNCPMCPRKFAKITGHSMELSRFKKVLNNMPFVKYITLLGRGETLMAPDLHAMLATGDSRPLKYTIVTNGTLLSEKMIQRLKHVNRIVVSIDSPSPETYGKIRGADLNRLIANLKLLARTRRDIGITIQSLIMKENASDLPDFINLAQKTGADQVTFIHPIGFDQELEKTHGEHFNNIIQEGIKECLRQSKSNGIMLRATPLFQKPRICYEPWTSPRVALNGDIYPCCYIYESSEPVWNEYYQGLCYSVPQRNYIMGNIFKDDFASIWNDKPFRELRKTVRLTQPTSKPEPDTLSRVRENAIRSTHRFAYCNACLYRLNKAC